MLLQSTIKTKFTYSFFLPPLTRIKRAVIKPIQTKPKITIIMVPFVQDTIGMFINCTISSYTLLSQKYKHSLSKNMIFIRILKKEDVSSFNKESKPSILVWFLSFQYCLIPSSPFSIAQSFN